MTDLYTGSDSSIAHGSVVTVDGEGRTVLTRYYHGVKKWAVPKLGGSLLAKLNRKRWTDKTLYELARLHWLAAWYSQVFDEVAALAAGGEMHLCIEGYAFSRGNRAHQIGEIGGLVKILAVQSGFGVRIHGPTVRASFATGNGKAEKEEVEAAVRENYSAGLDLEAFQLDEIRHDVCDARVLAEMVRIECLVKRGEIDTRDLPERQRFMFLKTTESYQDNLATREFATADNVAGGDL